MKNIEKILHINFLIPLINSPFHRSCDEASQIMIFSEICKKGSSGISGVINYTITYYNDKWVKV